jgi:hypothetical protein
MVHDLRAFEGLLLDPVDDVEMDLLGRSERQGSEQERDEDGSVLHGITLAPAGADVALAVPLCLDGEAEASAPLRHLEEKLVVALRREQHLAGADVLDPGRQLLL